MAHNSGLWLQRPTLKRIYGASLLAIRLVIRLKAAKLPLKANEWRPMAGKMKAEEEEWKL